MESLKRLSVYFNVSINTLLSSLAQPICQCCGMPLDDASMGRELDKSFNESYCKWCYHNGEFVYHSLIELTDFLVEHLSNENWIKEYACHFLRNSCWRILIGVTILNVLLKKRECSLLGTLPFGMVHSGGINRLMALLLPK